MINIYFIAITNVSIIILKKKGSHCMNGYEKTLKWNCTSETSETVQSTVIDVVKTANRIEFFTMNTFVWLRMLHIFRHAFGLTLCNKMRIFHYWYPPLLKYVSPCPTSTFQYNSKEIYYDYVMLMFLATTCWCATKVEHNRTKEFQLQLFTFHASSRNENSLLPNQKDE